MMANMSQIRNIEKMAPNGIIDTALLASQFASL
jgi:hypothetical protein